MSFSSASISASVPSTLPASAPPPPHTTQDFRPVSPSQVNLAPDLLNWMRMVRYLGQSAAPEARQTMDQISHTNPLPPELVELIVLVNRVTATGTFTDLSKPANAALKAFKRQHNLRLDTPWQSISSCSRNSPYTPLPTPRVEQRQGSGEESKEGVQAL